MFWSVTAFITPLFGFCVICEYALVVFCGLVVVWRSVQKTKCIFKTYPLQEFYIFPLLHIYHLNQPVFRDSGPSHKSLPVQLKSEDYEMRTELPNPCEAWPACWDGEFRTDLTDPCQPWPSCWNGGL